MDKEVGTVALVLVAILAIFVAIQPLLPSNGERFSELAFSDQTRQSQTIQLH